MPALRYRCPATSQDVTSTIETTAKDLQRLRQLQIWVACPHCPGGHRIPANEMFFAGWQAPAPRARDPVG